MELTNLELARLNQSLAGKLRNEAQKRKVPADLVRKQYVFTLFLSRIFDVEPQPPWVLLGGNALMIRTGSGRFTTDIDLAKEGDWAEPEQLRDELQAMVDVRPDRDPFIFTIEAVVPHSEPDPFGYGGATAKAKVNTHLGGSLFEGFSIDLTLRRHVDSSVDHVALRPVIDHPTLENLPTIPTTPLENHLADKVCALYEKHANGPSSRYRDLADIVRILEAGRIDAGRLRVVLVREQQRRKMDLPSSMRAPSDSWTKEFPAQARDFAEYPAALYSLDASLDATRPCLDPVLAGTRNSGIWDPRVQEWIDLT